MKRGLLLAALVAAGLVHGSSAYACDPSTTYEEEHYESIPLTLYQTVCPGMDPGESGKDAWSVQIDGVELDAIQKLDPHRTYGSGPKDLPLPKELARFARIEAVGDPRDGAEVCWEVQSYFYVNVDCDSYLKCSDSCRPDAWRCENNTIPGILATFDRADWTPLTRHDRNCDEPPTMPHEGGTGGYIP